MRKSGPPAGRVFEAATNRLVTDHRRRRYRLGPDGTAAEYLGTTPALPVNDTDWYRAGAARGAAGWAGPFQVGIHPVLAISAYQPFYDGAGAFRGVIATDWDLSGMSAFLRSLEVCSGSGTRGYGCARGLGFAVCDRALPPTTAARNRATDCSFSGRKALEVQVARTPFLCSPEPTGRSFTIRSARTQRIPPAPQLIGALS